MVDDFLRWPLPDSVCADGCATKQGPGRVGTNLLTAVETKTMLEEVVMPKIAEETTRLRKALESSRDELKRQHACWTGSKNDSWATACIDTELGRIERAINPVAPA